VPLFDDDELARMEESLASRGAAARPRRHGAGGLILVVLALVAIGVVALLAWRSGKREGPADESAAAASETSRAGEAATLALGERPRLATPPPAIAPSTLPDRDAEAEAQRRFEERRAQLAETRPSQRDSSVRRRADERQRTETWWRRHAGSIEALDDAAARVVHPGTTRIDAACAEYVRIFDELLATDLRPAPTDGLATALQRYLFFHTNAATSCRAARFLDVQAQLATWDSASRLLEAKVAEALSQ